MNNNPTATPQDFFPSWFDPLQKGDSPIMLTENERQLIKIILDFYHIAIEEVLSDYGKYPCAEAKQMCWLLLTNIFGTRNTAIAKYFQKNHSTILNGIGRIRGLIEYDKKVKENYEQILKLI